MVSPIKLNKVMLVRKALAVVEDNFDFTYAHKRHDGRYGEARGFVAGRIGWIMISKAPNGLFLTTAHLYLNPGLGLGMYMCPRRGSDMPSGSKLFPTGDANFDGHFFLKGNSQEEVLRSLTMEVRAGIMALCEMGGSVRVSDALIDYREESEFLDGRRLMEAMHREATVAATLYSALIDMD